MVGMGGAAFDGCEPGLRIEQAQRRGALRAERALIDWAARVALDLDGLAILCVDQLAAPDRAEGANAGPYCIGLFEPWPQRSRHRAFRRLGMMALAGGLTR